jgi:anti-anti-sigma factor
LFADRNNYKTETLCVEMAVQVERVGKIINGSISHQVACEGRMSIISKSNSQIIVQPEVSLVSSTAETFRQELLQIVNQNNCELVVDLSLVTDIDSVGLGVFIATFNTLAKKEKKLCVINASEKLHSLFRTMGLTRRFKVSGDNASS